MSKICWDTIRASTPPHEEQILRGQIRRGVWGALRGIAAPSADYPGGARVVSVGDALHAPVLWPEEVGARMGWVLVWNMSPVPMLLVPTGTGMVSVIGNGSMNASQKFVESCRTTSPVAWRVLRDVLKEVRHEHSIGVRYEGAR